MSDRSKSSRYLDRPEGLTQLARLAEAEPIERLQGWPGAGLPRRADARRRYPAEGLPKSGPIERLQARRRLDPMYDRALRDASKELAGESIEAVLTRAEALAGEYRANGLPQPPTVGERFKAAIAGMRKFRAA